ncbi:unnamed protein product [Cochlearia groenlandica]
MTMESENRMYGQVWDEEGNPKKMIKRVKEVTSGKSNVVDYIWSQQDDYKRRRCLYLQSYEFKRDDESDDIERRRPSKPTMRKFLLKLKKLVRSKRLART